MLRFLPEREIADHIQPLRRRLQIRVGKPGAIYYGKIRASYLNADDAHLRISRRNLRCREVAGGHIVYSPRNSDEIVCPRGNSFHTCVAKMPKCVRPSAAVSGPGMSRQDMQDAHAELAVLILLAPDARRQYTSGA